MILTIPLIEATKTKNGGFTKRHFELFGFESRVENGKRLWCPLTGWKNRLAGKYITDDQLKELRSLVIAFHGDIDAFDSEVRRVMEIESRGGYISQGSFNSCF